MAILNHGSTIRTADGGQSTTAIVTASNIGTYGVAANSTYYIGTAQNVFNRASGAQTLTGVSIDGNAANITAYTINQNVGTGNAPSFTGMTSTAMLVSSTSLSSNYDWQNSPISIRERGLVGAGQSTDTYSPNINFHWSGRWSSSLWMNQNGNLNWGGYGDTGVPANEGVFRTGSIYANIYYDKNNSSYYIDPASTSIVNAFKVYDALYFGDYTTYLSQSTPYLRITTANGYGNFGPANSSWFHMTTDRPNFYMAVGLHINGDLFIYNTQSQLTSTSVRAPIFYDTNNTAYYLDPANTGTSLLVAGNVGIGTTSPAAKLVVLGETQISSNAAYITHFNYQDTGVHFISMANSGYTDFRGSSNNITTMRVRGDGNVGIGTTSPSQVLHVVGNVKLNSVFGEGSTTGVTAFTHATSSTQPSMYLWGKDHASYPGQVHIIGRSDNASADAGKIGFYDYNGSGWDLNMVINKSGNVGIGTTSPIAMLHIESSNSQGDNKGLIYLKSTSGTNVLKIGVDGTNNFSELRAYTPGVGDNSKLILQPYGGNVGIGTTSPGTKLHVVGAVTMPVIKQSTTLYAGTDITDDDSTRTVYFNIPIGGYSPSKYFKVARIKITGNYQNVSLNGYFTTTNSTGLHVGFERKVEFDFIAYAAINPGAPTVTYLKRGPDTTTVLVYAVPNGGGANTTYYDVYIRSGWYNDTNGELAIRVGYSSAVTIWQAGLDSGTSAPADTLVNPNSNYSFDTTGNVGIGAASPAYKLDINSANDDALRIRNGAGGANNGLALCIGSGSPWLDITEGVEFRIKGNTYANLGTWNSGNNTKLLINSSGNIGIGTTSPSWLLTAYAASAPQFTLSNATRNFILTNNAGDGLLSFNYASVNRLQFDTTNQWFNTGNVGIGTTSPGSKLDVNGTFRTAINNLTIFNDYIYVSPTNNNTLNSGYFANSIADMWINFRGYNDGQTQFRNFNVGDGKGANIAWFDGTNKRMSVNNGQAASYPLHVVGTAYSDTDFRAPIFYDSNDTAYYVDPNSVSRLSSLRVYSAFDTASSDVYANMRVMRNSATTDGMYIGYGNSGSTSALTRIFGGGATTGELSKYSTYTLEPGSFRSPIFYDSDNTAYYIDAASTSNLNNLTVAGTMTFGTLAYVTESRRSKNSSNVDIETVTGLVSPSGPTFLEIRGFCPPTMYRTTGDRPAPYGLGFGNGIESGGIMPIGAGDNLQEIMLYGANSGPTTFTFKRQIWEGNAQDPSFSNYYGSSVFSINTGTGAVTASTDIRSPIYYDQNNTSYYIDAASTSVLNAFTGSHSGGSVNVTSVNGAYIGVNNTTNTNGYGISLYNGAVAGEPTYGIMFQGTATFGTHGSVTGNWSTYFTMNNDDTRGWIFRKAGTGNVASLSAGGILTLATDVRAPIFYDSANTSYYIDPASTSNLVGLTVANTITGSISGNAATATNSTQLGGVAAANYVRNDVDGTDSTALFRLTTITKSLTITTSWLDTGIVGANLATGCYMISVYVDNYAVSGGHYQETYTGMMSWFSTGTNSTDYDEIVLHKSGHASNGAYINLRTIRQLSGGTNLKLQIISSVSTSGASNYVFKFRRLI